MLNWYCYRTILETIQLCANKITLGPFKKYHQQNMFTNHIYLIYMYKEDLALYDLQWLICHETKPNQASDFKPVKLHLK